jgi:hypothetical protein
MDFDLRNAIPLRIPQLQDCKMIPPISHPTSCLELVRWVRESSSPFVLQFAMDWTWSTRPLPPNFVETLDVVSACLVDIPPPLVMIIIKYAWQNILIPTTMRRVRYCYHREMLVWMHENQSIDETHQ